MGKNALRSLGGLLASALAVAACSGGPPGAQQEPVDLGGANGDAARELGSDTAGSADLGSARDSGADAGGDAANEPDRGNSSDVGPDGSDAPPPQCARTWEQLVADLEREAPDRDSGAVVPQGLPAVETSVTLALAGEFRRAEESAGLAGYELCSDGDTLRWTPSALSQGLPLLSVRTGDAADLVLEHPHPFFDGTLETAQTWWSQTGARAMLVNGAHRCSSSVASSCDGTTAVCAGSTAAYPVSDPAHNTGTAFDGIHRALAAQWPSSTVVSLHGTAQDVVYVSDGTRGAGASDNLVARLVSGLATAFPGVTVRSCDEYEASVPGPWLCGTSNVQGRHLNGSADACTESAPASTGRFIHLEQPRSLRLSAAEASNALRAALQ